MIGAPIPSSKWREKLIITRTVAGSDFTQASAGAAHIYDSAFSSAEQSLLSNSKKICLQLIWSSPGVSDADCEYIHAYSDWEYIKSLRGKPQIRQTIPWTFSSGFLDLFAQTSSVTFRISDSIWSSLSTSTFIINIYSIEV